MADRPAVRSVTVVTVTYGDRWRYLGPVLAGLDALDDAALVADIVIVANGVAPEARRSIDAAVAADPRIQVVHLDANRGSAAGFGAGIARAVELDNDHVWLLDDDNLPEPGALAALVAAQAAHREPAAFQSLRPGHPSLPPTAATPCQLPWGLYGGLFAPRAAFAAAGTPRADFVLYGDDTEYTYRFAEQGWELVLVPGSVVVDLEDSWWAHTRRTGARSAVPGLRSAGERQRMYYTVRNSLFFQFHRVGRLRVRLVARVVAKSAALLLMTAAASLRHGSREPLANLGVYVLASCHGIVGRLGPREEPA